MHFKTYSFDFYSTHVEAINVPHALVNKEKEELSLLLSCIFFIPDFFIFVLFQYIDVFFFIILNISFEFLIKTKKIKFIFTFQYVCYPAHTHTHTHTHIVFCFVFFIILNYIVSIVNKKWNI